MTPTEHLGRQRMEQSTYQSRPRYGPRAPVPRRTWWALMGRVMVLGAAALLLAGLATFGRAAPGRAYDPRGAGFTWSAVEPDSGRVVSRAEWVERALTPAAL